MSYAKLAHLVRALREKTNSGKIEWKSTAEDGVFQASFPSYSTQISKRPTQRVGFGGDDFVLSVIDHEGKLLEQAADIDFDPVMLPPDPLGVMQGLYDVARRQALGVEQALDALLRELGEDPEDHIPF